MAEELTAQQRQAVENRGGKLLVSAAAGSGKTKVLVDRLLGYLVDPVNPANLDDFLIITYTKAAAAELRGKIAAKLSERISQDPENRHLQKQMQRLYLTKISTVHSFCADTLRDYASRLDISADFRVADENECLQLQERALTTTLDEAYENSGSDPDFCAFIDSQGLGRDDRQIPVILLGVYHKSRCHLDPDGWLDWCVDTMNTQSVADAAETVWGRYLMDDLFSCLNLHIQALETCAQAASSTQHMEKPASLLYETLDQLRSLRNSRTWDEVVARRNIVYGTLSFSKKCEDMELVEQIKAVRNACKDAVGKKLRRFNDCSSQILEDIDQTMPAVRGLIALTRKFSDVYDKLKKNKRILDFGDLEHRMLDLLLGRHRNACTPAARELSGRFKEVLVDEYQDSNSVQDAIFNAITEEKQNLFMVGDVKQSIYQFRLADPGIFLDKYNRFAHAKDATDRNGRKILLSSNFRSGGGVIHAVNDVFSCCMSPKVGGLVYSEDEALNEGIPHVALEEPEIELHTIKVDSDTYAEEASFVAERINQLLDGTHMVRDKDTLRPIKAEDIVILLRSPGSVGIDFEQALEQRGIRCVTGSTTDLLQAEEIEVLRSILQIISNPLQDIPLIASLSSRVFGFKADDLARIRAGKTNISFFAALGEDPEEKTKNFLGMLSKLRFDSRMCTISELLDKIFLLTGLDSIYSAMDDGELRRENLQYFYQLAVNFENGGMADLEQFLEYLSAMDAKGLAVTDEKNTADAVTIMSIHKSKGLEFPVVFLCGLSKTFNMEDVRGQVLCHMELGLGLSCVDLNNRVRYPSIVKRAIAARMQADSVSEELRVLYVAMTRAKDRLIMTYASRTLEKEISELSLRMDLSDPLLLTEEVASAGEWVLYAALHRAEAQALFTLGRRPAVAEDKCNAWHISVSDGRIDSAACQRDVSSDDQVVARQILDGMRKGLSFRYPYEPATRTASKQTATQLKGRYKDQEAAEGAVKPQHLDRIFRKPTFIDSHQMGKVYGTVLHTVMQYIRYEACTDEDAVRREVDRLVQEKYISEELGRLVHCGDIATLFQTKLGKMIQTSPNVLREFKFSILDDADRYAAQAAGEHVLLQGVVDCAMIEEDGITIVDFKTDSVTQATVAAAVKRYRPQVDAYAYALSKIFKLPIKRVCLYFFRLGRFETVL